MRLSHPPLVLCAIWTLTALAARPAAAEIGPAPSTTTPAQTPTAALSLEHDKKAVGTWRPSFGTMVIEAEEETGAVDPMEAMYREAGKVEKESAAEDLIFALSAGLIVLLGFAHSYWHTRRRQLPELTRLREAKQLGTDVPASLYPLIDPTQCIGCGSCAQACPEPVLGVVAGRAHLLSAGDCVGHGVCAEVCPQRAIKLVFGTDKRPYELPKLDERFRTTAPGVFVAGELGGMGLIANAFDQASEVIDTIAEELREEGPTNEKLADVVIVGAGPAGLGAALRAKELGLRYVCVDQEQWGGAIRNYPRGKIVMTRSLRVPIYGPVKLRTTTKEALVELFSRIVEETGVRINSGVRVQDIRRDGRRLLVETSRGVVGARRVLLAMGRGGTPRKLGVAGEDQDHVAYRMLEPEKYAGTRVAVIGGGDVACEIATALAEQPETHVALLYRGKALSRPKSKNRERVQRAVASGRLELVLEMAVQRITSDTVVVTQSGGPERAVPADNVFVCAGGVPPGKFLEKIGVENTVLRGEANRPAA